MQMQCKQENTSHSTTPCLTQLCNGTFSQQHGPWTTNICQNANQDSYSNSLLTKRFTYKSAPPHLSLLASRSDSSRVMMSPSRTGPLTFLMMARFVSSMNSTRTWVHWPWEPVRPSTLVTWRHTRWGDCYALVALGIISGQCSNIAMLLGIRAVIRTRQRQWGGNSEQRGVNLICVKSWGNFGVAYNLVPLTYYGKYQV